MGPPKTSRSWVHILSPEPSWLLIFVSPTKEMWARIALVDIETRYGLDGPGSNPGRAKRFSIFHVAPDGHWGPTLRPVNGYWDYFQGVNRPGRGVEHPPQSNTEVRMSRVIPLLPPLCQSWHITGWTLLNRKTDAEILPHLVPCKISWYTDW